MTKSTVDVLSEAVSKVRRRILRIRDRGEKIGEENTKNALINPLLRALGWDIGELDEVSMEYRRKPKDNPVDYALFLLRKECLFIEAKALEKDIDDDKWTLQVLSYATAVGVEWCVLTNGDEYRLYNSLAPVPADKKLFRNFRVSEANENDFALETLQLISKDKMGENRLKVLWRAHFIDSHVKAALQKILSPDNDSIVRLIKKTTQGIGPVEIRESLKRADIQISFPVPHIGGELEEPGPTPPGKPGIKDLIKAGVIKTPFHLEADYKGKKFTATVQADGSVLFDGKKYSSLSTAAGMARATVRKPPPGRTYPQTNGWTFWKFRKPGNEELVAIDVLRKRT